MEAKTSHNKLVVLGAQIALAGFVLSGPLALATVMLTRPQPQWVSAASFVEHYHPIQNMPYYFGLLLVGGILMLVAGHYLNANAESQKQRYLLLLSLAWTIVFAALIAFNYICQTTFVHNMSKHYKPEYDAVISAFSMSNPVSFCWANEMWGYGFLGVATWLMSAYYSRRKRLIQYLLIVNGVISIIGVVWTIIDVFWMLTTAGLVAYAAWNILMIVLMILIWIDAKNQSDDHTTFSDG